MSRTIRIVLLLAFLFYMLVVLNATIDATAMRTRTRRLVERYMKRLGPKSFLDGQRNFWYCRRGSKLAICHRKEYHAKANKTAPSLRTNGIQICSNATCRHGTCEHGTCQCQSGWTGRRCNIDTNECLTSRHFCAHFCINTHGSYRCTCRHSYKLHSNGKGCVLSYRERRQGPNRRPKVKSYRKRPLYSRLSDESINKSVNTSLPPKLYHHARTLPRPYRGIRINSRPCRKGCRYRCLTQGDVEKCVCPPGFFLAADGKSCIDRNECLDVSLLPCPSNKQCRNTYGRFICTCRVGYADGYNRLEKACIDVNECLTGEHKCGRNSNCLNTIGSYSCRCLPGSYKAGKECVRSDNTESDDVKSDLRYRYPWSRVKYPLTRRSDLE